MTWEEREEIFAKEILRKADFEKIFNVSSTKAGEIVEMIKIRKGSDLRFVPYGCIHVQDYFDVFKIDDKIRYTKIYEKSDMRLERKSMILEAAPKAKEIFLNGDKVDFRRIEAVDEKIARGNLKLVSFSFVGDEMRVIVA